MKRRERALTPRREQTREKSGEGRERGSWACGVTVSLTWVQAALEVEDDQEQRAQASGQDHPADPAFSHPLLYRASPEAGQAQSGEAAAEESPQLLMARLALARAAAAALRHRPVSLGSMNCAAAAAAGAPRAKGKSCTGQGPTKPAGGAGEEDAGARLWPAPHRLLQVPLAPRRLLFRLLKTVRRSAPTHSLWHVQFGKRGRRPSPLLPAPWIRPAVENQKSLGVRRQRGERSGGRRFSAVRGGSRQAPV